MEDLPAFIIKIYKPCIKSIVQNQIDSYYVSTGNQKKLHILLLEKFDDNIAEYKSALPAVIEPNRRNLFVQEVMEKFSAQMESNDIGWPAIKYNNLKNNAFFVKWLQNTIICFLEQLIALLHSGIVCITRYLLLEDLLRACQDKDMIPAQSIERQAIDEKIKNLIDYAFSDMTKKPPLNQRPLSLKVLEVYLGELQKLHAFFNRFLITEVTLSLEYVLSKEKQSNSWFDEDKVKRETFWKSQQLQCDNHFKASLEGFNYVTGKVSNEKKALPCEEPLYLSGDQSLVLFTNRKVASWSKYELSKICGKTKNSSTDCSLFKKISKIIRPRANAEPENLVELEMETYDSIPKPSGNI